MHFNLAAGLEDLHAWSDHVYLLVDLDLLDGLITRVQHLFVREAIHEADHVLLFLPKSHHFCIFLINIILLNRHVIFNEVLFRVAFDLLYLLKFDLIQIILPVNILLVVANEEIHENLEHMRLQQRYNYKHAILGEYADRFVEIGPAAGHCFRRVIHRKRIKRTLINCHIKLAIFILLLQIRAISNRVIEREVGWLA